MTLDSSKRKRRWVTWMLVVCVVAGAAGPASADDLDRASTAWAAGRVDEAAGALLDYWLTDPTDPARVLEAVRLAEALDDADLLERAQGQLEGLLRDSEDPRLQYALGRSSLAIARNRMARGDTGSSLAFLLADAKELGLGLLEVPGWYAVGTAMAADAMWSQGDLTGALALLDGVEAGDDDAPLAALRGRLLYERAVSEGLGTDGRPTDAGREDLGAAVTWSERARTHEVRPLADADRGAAALVSAWAKHRLGDVKGAARAYLDAHVVTPRSPLPLRGLQSLYTGREAALADLLQSHLADHPDDTAAWDLMIPTRRTAGDLAGALQALQRRLDVAPADPAGWTHGGRLFQDLEQWREAGKHYRQALELDGTHAPAAAGLEQVARAVWTTDMERGLEIYEGLLALRPADPYARNNLGFLLREAVTPWTTMSEGQIQHLKPDAPPHIRELLDRSVSVYREAVERIPDRDTMTELEAWSYAGIVNDYGLMLHYFADVQDPLEAERQYLRALAMTDHSFADTFIPNMRRLYATVLPNREWTWYRLAREARYTILRLVPVEGLAVLEPDEDKRRLAAQDEHALRLRLARELARDADEAGEPWPPPEDD